MVSYPCLYWVERKLEIALGGTINFLTYPSVIYISSIDLTMVWAGNAGKSIQQNVISDVFGIRKASRISYYLIFWNIKTICNLGYIQISRYGIGSLNLLGYQVSWLSLITTSLESPNTDGTAQ